MNLLVTGAWQYAKNYFNEIEMLGHKVSFMQQEKDELPCDYSWVEGVVCNGLFLNHSIERFVNLRYIQLTSAGLDRVPIDYVNAHGIELHNAKGVYSVPMAEFAVGGVLQLYKQSRFFAENQKAHKWEKHRGLLELFGRTVCIVGCGSVGTECAKRFKAFGCDIVGIDLFPRADENYSEIYPLESLDELLSEVDVLVLTLPLTEETKYLINAERLGKLKSNAVIVNIARGAIIDTEALVKTLPEIGGAVLDVFEEEPLVELSPLWDMENVVVSAHCSFVGDNNSNRLSKLIIYNLEKK